MSENEKLGTSPVEKQKQLVLRSHVKETSLGTETLSFTIRLGPIKIICIANIPDEGKDGAPVYVKIEA